MPMILSRGGGLLLVLLLVLAGNGCDEWRAEPTPDVTIPAEGEAMPDVNINIEGDPPVVDGDEDRVDQIDVQIGDEGVGVQVN